MNGAAAPNGSDGAKDVSSHNGEIIEDQIHQAPKKVREGRNIVILLDGTNNQFGDHNTNLIKLMGVLKSDKRQLLYYSSGVGTILPESSGSWGKVRQWAAKIIDLGLAANFKTFVLDAYKFLMDTYKEGDRVYIFGFSRGSYTARALAGMIQRVGLLPARNYNQVGIAYRIYTRVDKEGTRPGLNAQHAEAAQLYRRIFGVSRRVTVEFVGVWDTVSSLGGFGLPRLPFAGGVRAVRFFRHAMALDERRARFICEYRRPDQSEIEFRQRIAAAKAHGDPNVDGLESEFRRKYPKEQVPSAGGPPVERSKEVWFMGCHSDVGGGNSLNNDPSLSNIPFRWMLREALSLGLLLGPVGMAVTPALLPPELGDPDSRCRDTYERLLQLKSLLASEPFEGDQANFDRRAIDAAIDNFDNDDLVSIVRAAAALDTQPWADVERAHLDQGSPAQQAVSAPVASSSTATRSLPRICMDIFQAFKESLTWPWWILEMLPLVTRQYHPDGPKDENIWQIHWFRGRQMVPTQLVHRSVQKRLQWEHAQVQAGARKRRVAYWEPAARPALGSPAWAQVREGTGQWEDGWEN